MTGKIRVERANAERDAGHIARLIQICREERLTVLDGLSTEEERRYIEQLQSRDAIFVASINKVFVGFASVTCRWRYSEQLRHCAESGTWVMPKFRRNGVGSALWQQGILPWCQEVGFKHIGFFVMSSNQQAIAFYKHIGFKKCGFHRKLIYYDGKYFDALEMEMWCAKDSINNP